MTSTTRRMVVVGALAALAGCIGDDEEDDDDGDDAEHAGPSVGDIALDDTFPIEFEDPDTGEKIADLHYHDDGGTHWHAQPIEVPLNEERTVVVRVYDADVELLDVGEDGVVEVRYLADEEATDIVSTAIDGDRLTLVGEEVGSTEPRLKLVAEGDTWTTPSMRVAVEEDD